MRKRKYAQGYINDENMQDIKGKSSFRSEGTKSKWAHKERVQGTRTHCHEVRLRG